MYLSRYILSNIYYQMLEEGVEEKIPKLLPLVPTTPIERFKNETDEDKAEFIRWVAELFDPSPNGMYLGWILKMFKNGSLRGEEDSEKVNNTLKLFTSLKAKPKFPVEYKDINKFKSYGDLYETVEKFSDIKSKGEIIREKEKGIILIDTNGDYKLYIVTEAEAGAKHFRNTQWCVKDPRYFNQYDPPYYYFTKNDEPYTLLHLNSNQCMDVYDRDTDLNGIQIDMMETEEVTNYVLAHDNSDKAIYHYIERVGHGYDDMMITHLNNQIEEYYNSLEFKHYNISMNDYYEGLISVEAEGSIPYNLRGLEDYFDDREFKQTISKCLSREYIYVDYDDLQFSDDMKSIYFTLRPDYNEYYNSSEIDNVITFIDFIHRLDSNYEDMVESFTERLTEDLLDDGYITSIYKKFKEKVLDNLDSEKLSNLYIESFSKTTSHNFITGLAHTDAMKFQSDGLSINKLYKSHPLNEHPLVILSKFFKYFDTPKESQISIKIYRNGDLRFEWNPSYSEDMTMDDYMRDYKIMMSINNNFDSYKKDILNFCNKYVIPYSEFNSNNDFEIPKDLNIPILSPRSRKSPKEQGYFQFKENKLNKFSKLYNKIIVEN